jgi:hypothetical protein
MGIAFALAHAIVDGDWSFRWSLSTKMSSSSTTDLLKSNSLAAIRWQSNPFAGEAAQ